MSICGIDLGAKKDTVFFEQETFTIEHSSSGWRSLDKRLPKDCVLVYEGRCAQLEKALGHRKLYSLDTTTSAKIRKALGEAKDDARDSKFLAELMEIRPKQFRAVKVRDQKLQKLRDMSRQRRSMVEYKTMMLQQLQASRPRRGQSTEEWLKGFRGKPEMCTVRMLNCCRQQIKKIDEKIKKLGHELPKVNLLKTIKGMGPILSAEIITEMDGFEDFATSAGAQAYAGTAPVTISSGSKRRVQLRRRCNRKARNALYYFAFCSTLFNPWARAYYDRCRARGIRHSSAIRSLSNRWMPILFAMLKNETPYDPRRKKLSITCG